MDRPLADLLRTVLARARAGEGEDGGDEGREELGRALGWAIASARAAWPDWVTDETFVSYVAVRATSGDDESPSGLARAISELRVADLYLACACVSGNGHALAAFEEQCIAPLDRVLTGFSMHPAALDETKQALRYRLFVGDGRRPGKIGDYAGRGELRAWVRAAAVRTAWRSLRRPKGETFVESHVMRAVAVVEDDLELDYLKRRYTLAFEDALRDAFAELPVRDRNVSRYYYGKGLGIDAIGALYRVHRSTAARWVNSATAALIAATRRLLMGRLGANRSEVSSVVRMLQSRIDVTLRAVAAACPTPKAG